MRDLFYSVDITRNKLGLSKSGTYKIGLIEEEVLEKIGLFEEGVRTKVFYAPPSVIPKMFHSPSSF